MKFQHLNIFHFRGIDKLHISDLKRINLLLGKNNSGKTSVLESLFLLSGASNHTLPETINRLRSREEGGFKRLRYLYHNVNMENHPTFEANMDDGMVRNLEIHLKENLRMKRVAGANSPVIPTTDESGVSAQCLSLKYYCGPDTVSKKYLKSEVCFLNNGEIQEERAANYIESLTARFITSYTNATALNQEMSSLIRKNKKQEVISLARIFDEKINNIEVLPDSLYIGFEGTSELIPIGLCGEGFKKFLYIIVSAVNSNQTILLIDEIENGIHYSIYPHLWKSIIALAEKNDLQIMVTTHSLETIMALSQYLSSKDVEETTRNEVSVYTISQTSLRGLQSYRYELEGVRNLLSNNIEIRK